MKLLLLFVLTLPVTLWAQTIQCPNGSFQKTEDKEGMRTIFCQKSFRNEKAEMVYIMDGPVRVYEGVNQLKREGQFKENTPHGLWKEYYSNGQVQSEYEVDPKGEAEGQITKYHKNGVKRSTGVVKASKPMGDWKFYSKEGKLLAEGEYSEVEQTIKQYDDDQAKLEKSQADKMQTIAQQQLKKKKTKLSKNWIQKDKGSVKAWYDSAGKLYWSSMLGRANWFNASLKCKNIGWKLPTVEEFNGAIARGLIDVSDEMRQPYWSAIDQILELDPQRSMMLGDNSAWVIIPGEGEVPGKRLTDENAVVCVSK